MYTPTATVSIFISSITITTYSKYVGIQIDSNNNNTDRECHSSHTFHNLFPEFTRKILDSFINSYFYTVMYQRVTSKSN